MTVQYTTNTEDTSADTRILSVALGHYSTPDNYINDGKHAVIVRSEVERIQFWVTSVPYAQILNKYAYLVVISTEMKANATLHPTVTPKLMSHSNVNKLLLRRPRNQYTVYRQWMSAKIHASNTGLTAASQIVARAWRAEKSNLPLSWRNLHRDPMTVDERLIQAGY
ncbi:hypothetical protein N657DRAFT_654395 [Parathielavia appendiculata]|uniref:Uncharacterized protein n=1 Tax=Parathielavia appendiculata TaxID=2587402 RepID=A0AAN6Z606_9PEZI|nr:hypothetical protein N657DRAFT_654395 [Parathielavia appendiculata]